MPNKPSRGGFCQHHLLFLVPSSKDSSPTLASKVDQLEGMLKMLREDLKKVNTSSQSRVPGLCKLPLNKRPFSGTTCGCSVFSGHTFHELLGALFPLTPLCRQACLVMCTERWFPARESLQTPASPSEPSLSTSPPLT